MEKNLLMLGYPAHILLPVRLTMPRYMQAASGKLHYMLGKECEEKRQLVSPCYHENDFDLSDLPDTYTL